MAKLILTFLFLFFSAFAIAQNDSLRQITSSSYLQIAQIETNTMRDSLSLNSQQLSKAILINKNYYLGIVEMKNSNLTADERSQTKAQLDANRNNQLASELSEVQYEQYIAMLQNKVKQLSNIIQH